MRFPGWGREHYLADHRVTDGSLASLWNQKLGPVWPWWHEIMGGTLPEPMSWEPCTWKGLWRGEGTAQGSQPGAVWPHFISRSHSSPSHGQRRGKQWTVPLPERMCIPITCPSHSPSCFCSPELLYVLGSAVSQPTFWRFWPMRGTTGGEVLHKGGDMHASLTLPQATSPASSSWLLPSPEASRTCQLAQILLLVTPLPPGVPQTRWDTIVSSCCCQSSCAPGRHRLFWSFAICVTNPLYWTPSVQRPSVASISWLDVDYYTAANPLMKTRV